MKKCPECGSTSGLRKIIYGLPDGPFDDDKYESGGCCIPEIIPTRLCRDCGWQGEFVSDIDNLTQGY